MDNLFIERNIELKTPEIDFKTSGELKMEGRSVSENPVTFFEPIVQWINQFKKKPSKSVVFSLKLEYFNTSTSKILLQIFRVMEGIAKEGSDVKIIWYYDPIDDDMLQAGKDYQSILRIPFQFAEIK